MFLSESYCHLNFLLLEKDDILFGESTSAEVKGRFSTELIRKHVKPRAAKYRREAIQHGERACGAVAGQVLWPSLPECLRKCRPIISTARKANHSFSQELSGAETCNFFLQKLE